MLATILQKTEAALRQNKGGAAFVAKLLSLFYLFLDVTGRRNHKPHDSKEAGVLEYFGQP
jgi:hypothetical protein